MKREKLIEFRGDRSQAEMGRVYGVTQQAWSYWENGFTAPSLATAKQIEIDSGVSRTGRTSRR